MRSSSNTNSSSSRRRFSTLPEIPSIKHYSPFLDWCRDDAKVEAVEEIMLDRSYILNLLFDIHCTPAEVARLEKINDMLLEMTNRTYHRTADMTSTIVYLYQKVLIGDSISGSPHLFFAAPRRDRTDGSTGICY